MKINCPFYGYSMFISGEPRQAPAPFVLMSSAGNQCALIVGKHSPCYMEINQLPVHWSECPYIIDIRIKGPRS